MELQRDDQFQNAAGFHSTNGSVTAAPSAAALTRNVHRRRPWRGDSISSQAAGSAKTRYCFSATNAPNSHGVSRLRRRRGEDERRDAEHEERLGPRLFEDEEDPRGRQVERRGGEAQAARPGEGHEDGGELHRDQLREARILEEHLARHRQQQAERKVGKTELQPPVHRKPRPVVGAACRCPET